MTREQLLKEMLDHKDTIERVEDDLRGYRLSRNAVEVAECERILAEERAWLRECQDELWGNALGTDNAPEVSAISETTPTANKEQA
jgi:hypothetical protein